MHVAELSAAQRLIFNGAKDTTRVLVLGWLAAIAILAGKLLTRQETLTVGGLDLPVRYAWLLFGALTALHLFKGGFLVAHINEYRRAPSAQKQALYEEIRAESNPFLYGLLPRGTRRAGGLSLMDPRDPSAWMAYVGQITVVVAVLPWSLSSSGGLSWPTGWGLWAQVLGALVLAEVNWLVGSRWLVALASLGDRDVRWRRPSERRAAVLGTLSLVPLALVVLIIGLPVLLVIALWEAAHGRRLRLSDLFRS